MLDRNRPGRPAAMGFETQHRNKSNSIRFSSHHSAGGAERNSFRSDWLRPCFCTSPSARKDCQHRSTYCLLPAACLLLPLLPHEARARHALPSPACCVSCEHFFALELCQLPLVVVSLLALPLNPGSLASFLLVLSCLPCLPRCLLERRIMRERPLYYSLFVASLVVLLLLLQESEAFRASSFPTAPQSSSASAFISSTRTGTTPYANYASTTTVDAPTRERTKEDQATSSRRPQRKRSSNDRDDYDLHEDDKTDYPDLEYLQDFAESRENDDPFHILLMGSTFELPKITVSYVSNSLEYVLAMPSLEATELSKFAKNEGFSCLGTWPRQECLELGKQLQRRDLVCRVVPFAEGGQRGWQAKDASSASSSSSSSSSYRSSGGE